MMMQPNLAKLPPRLLSVDDTCAALGLGRSLVYELMARGELESVAVGRRRLVKAASIDQFVDRLGSY